MIQEQEAAPAMVRAEIPADHPYVLVVTIDNPPVNVLHPTMYDELYAILTGITDRKDVKVVIITGAGERAFVAGANLKEWKTRTRETAAYKGWLSRRNYDSIYNCAAPVICAINGPAHGGGMLMAAAADMVICADNAVFSMPEINMGAFGGSTHLRRILPEAVLRYLLYTGDKVDGQFLLKHGAVLDVVPHAELMTAAFTLADKLAAKSGPFLRIRKESMALTEHLPLSEGYRVEQIVTTAAFSHPDAQEAAAAVVERRKPNWSGE